jgi:hypothetical protein
MTDTKMSRLRRVTTIINQLISPPLIKLALIKSGEAGQATEYPDAQVDRQH